MNAGQRAQRQFVMPPEWQRHQATWLSYPHAADTWPGGIENIFAPYHEFIRIISTAETVHISVNTRQDALRLQKALAACGTVMPHIVIHVFPTNDAWCRDHGPCFVFDRETGEKTIIDWGFNSWGGKYPFLLDDQIPAQAARVLDCPLVEPGLILEGGAIDVNGQGCLLTTESCLLNPNRNPQCARKDIEAALLQYLGARQVIWLGEGIAGDDTDGHVDDMTRFVSDTCVVTAIESDPTDENYAPLKDNLERLRRVRLADGAALAIVELPMPPPVTFANERLPASYANFYICNAAVVMPTFNCAQDDAARAILERVFDRPVVGIDATAIIQGLGSFHCLSRQEPAATSAP